MQVAIRERRPLDRLAPRRAGRFRAGLRNRIIIWAFAPTAIVLITVGLISLYTYQTVTEDLVIERDRELTRLSASQLAIELEAYTDPFSDQFMSVFDSGMVVFDANGRILSAEPSSIEGFGSQWYRRFPFRQMARSDEPVFSDVVVDGRKGEKVIVAYAPLLASDGDVVGGIGGLYLLGPASDNDLASTIEPLRRGEDSCIYLIDGRGRVIYHTDTAHIGADFSGHPIVQRVLAGEVGSLRTHDLAGRDIVASYAPVPDTTWGLITEERWQSLMQASQRYGRFLVGLLALGLATPALFVGFSVRRIMRPVQDLTHAAQEVASGNFDQRITAATGDELEDLAQQFNRMAARLQESYDHLERKVNDRTRELATLNTLAGVVSRSLDLEEILRDALDEALEIMGMSRGQALLLEEDTNELVQIAQRGLSDELIRYAARLPLGTGTSGQAASEGKALFRVVSDYQDSDLKRLLQAEGIRLVVSIPLLAKGKTLGIIDLGSPAERCISPEELSLLGAIGHQVGVAVENARLYERAQQLAIMEERSRLARDLHDAVTQTLFSASLIAQTLPSIWESDREDGRRLLGELRRLSRAALAEMRALLVELRPAALGEASLDQLLGQLAETVTGRTGVPVQVDVAGECVLPDDVHVALYRLAQEALNNVAKHAQASQVTVSLHCCPAAAGGAAGDADPQAMAQPERQVTRVELRIRDDGRGFDPGLLQPGEMGLSIMQERAAAIGATLEIDSRPGGGTSVLVIWAPDSAAPGRTAQPGARPWRERGAS